MDLKSWRRVTLLAETHQSPILAVCRVRKFICLGNAMTGKVLLPTNQKFESEPINLNTRNETNPHPRNHCFPLCYS